MINVVCVNQGTKYGSIYVDKLYNMVKRNLPLDFTFYCFTDTTITVNKNIILRPLPENVFRWWAKLFLFSKMSGLRGIIMYFDLDTVICNNLTKLVKFHSSHREKLILCSSVVDSRKLSLNFLKKPLLRRYFKENGLFNTSFMMWSSDLSNNIWDNFLLNKENIIKNYFADDSYISKNYLHILKSIPSEWFYYYNNTSRDVVLSKNDYKNQFMNADLNLDMLKFKKDNNELFDIIYKNMLNSELCVFKEKEELNINKQVCMLLFPGYPKPHTIQDTIIVNNWI